MNCSFLIYICLITIFLLLLAKLFPLYILIFLGFLAGRVLQAKRETVAKLLLYIIVPAVNFYGAATVPLSGAVLTLPLVFWAVCVTTCVLAYAVARLLWRDTTKNILAYACGTGNNGYFGIPLVIMLFSQSAFGIAVVAGMGFLLYEVTLGFFIVARGNLTVSESLRKLFSLPILYAFVAGLAWNAAGFSMSPPLEDLLLSFRGAFTVLGMMLIGMGFSSLKHLFVDVRFLAVAFFFKFVLWPLTVLSIVAADRMFFHLFGAAVHDVMIVLSIVPLAANTVIFATELKVHPEKAASAVFLSTLFALIYIPILSAFFL